MKTEFTIGKVLRPRGIKGVVKIETYSDNTARLTGLRTLNVGGTHYRVENASSEGVFLYVKLSGIDTPEGAEVLRGKEVKVARTELPPPPDGRYYIADLLGCDVFAGGERVGELVDVLQYGSADVYVVRTAEGSVSFPALKETVKEIDTENGVIRLDGRMFERTAVYNS